MHRRRKTKIRAILFWMVLFTILFAVLLRLWLSPIMHDLAISQVSNEASNLINDAIESQIQQQELDYERIVRLEKDINGNITAVKTNMAETNRLKTKILNIVNDKILETSSTDLGIPLGNLLMPELFSGYGPVIPLEIMTVSNSDAVFRNIFTAAGINQTLQRIMLEITLSVTVFTPLGIQTIDVSSDVIVAETVIVGSVPGSYVSIERGGAN